MHRKLAPLLAIVLLTAIQPLSGCYKCDGPDCSNVPPYYPDYPPNPPFGAELVGACERAGANLAQIGCPEGLNPRWVTACINGTELRRGKGGFPLACWEKAGDKPAALSCGSLRCVP